MKNLFLVLIIFLSLSSFGQLSGTYTIGGSGANYPRIDSAINHLKRVGISGPVTFNIKPGVYNEEVILDSCGGMGSSSPITIQKDPSKTGTVVWRGNRALIIQNSNSVNIRGIHFSRNSWSIFFRSYNSNIRIVNNYFSSNSYRVITNETINNGYVERILIDSNEVDGPGIFVFLNVANGSSLKILAQTISIRNNVVSGGNGHCIILDYYANCLISGNFINRRINNKQKLIDLRNSEEFIIEKNRFYFSSGTAIYIDNCHGFLSKPSKIENNGFHLSNSGVGIYSKGEHINIFNNTIRIEKPQFLYPGINIDIWSGPIKILNNNLINNSSGSFIRTVDSSYISTSNNNNFYYGKSKSSFIQNGKTLDLSQWNANLKLDSNSLSVDPLWSCGDTLKPANKKLDSAGKFIPSLLQDLNNVSRSNPPDIGCLEFTPPQIDGGIVEVVDSFCSGLSPVYARIKNFGTNKLISATVQWSIDTGSVVPQKGVKWTGSLNQNEEALVYLGDFNFKIGVRYSIKAATDSINGGRFGCLENDSARITNGDVRLGGTYSIGVVNSDFTSVAAAIYYVKANGMCGPVVFNISNLGGWNNPFDRLENVRGMSKLNRITFRTHPDSTKLFKVSVSSNGYNIPSFITLKRIEFAYSTYSNQILNLVGKDIIVDSCIIKSTKGDYLIKCFQTNDNTISNSILEGGAKDAIYIAHSSFINIFGNEIKNARFSEVNIEKSSDINIYENTIGNNRTLSNSVRSQSNGILVESSSRIRLFKNKIRTDSEQGIHVRISDTKIYNNFISLYNSGSDSYDNSDKTGIQIVGGSSEIYYNSVSVDKDLYSAKCIYLNNNSDTINAIVYNNALVNFGYKEVIRIGVYSAKLKIDYNSLYGNGKYEIREYGTPSQKYYTLKNYANKTGLLQNSIRANPFYYSKSNLHSNGHLLRKKGIVINGFTTDIDGELRNSSSPDIGADEVKIHSRDLSILNFTDSCLCPGNRELKIRIHNSGSDTIYNASFSISIATDSGAFVSLPNTLINLKLDPNKDTIVGVGSFLFSKTKNYKLRFSIANVNGLVDQFSQNDTLVTEKRKVMLSGFYSIGTSMADYWNSLDSAFIETQELGLCGPTTLYIKSSSFKKFIVMSRLKGSSYRNHLTILGDTVGVAPEWKIDAGGALDIRGVGNMTIRNIRFENLSVTGFRGNVNVVGNTFFGDAFVNTFNPFYGDTLHPLLKNTLKIENNNFVCVKPLQVYGSGDFYKRNSIDSVCVLNNNFAVMPARQGTSFGVRVGTFDYLKFERNNFINGDPQKGRISKMVAFGGSLVTIFSKNKIRADDYSVGVEITGNENSKNYVSNNFFSGYYSEPLIVNGGQHEIYNNSFHGFAVRIKAGETKFFNNSVQSKNPCLWVVGLDTTGAIFSNNNNFYSTDSSSSSRFIELHDNSKTSRITLSEWQNQYNQDKSSVTIDPEYVDSVDLHLSTNVLSGKGVYVGIDEDIDGDFRSPIPTIGADETPSKFDAAVGRIKNKVDSICTGSKVLSWRFVNVGIQNINEIDYTIEVKQGSSSSSKRDTLYKSLKPRDQAIVKDSFQTFITNGISEIIITINSVDQIRDSNRANDLLKYDLVVDEPGPINLGNDTSICVQDSILVGVSKTNVSYLWNTGDSISHLWVSKSGNYWLRIENKRNCVSADSISIQTNAVCVGIDENFSKNTTINYYPNPNSGTFNLNLNSEFNGEVKLIVRNMQGQIVSSESWMKTETDMIREINLNDQPSGVYFLDLITPLGKAQHRITINK